MAQLLFSGKTEVLGVIDSRQRDSPHTPVVVHSHPADNRQYRIGYIHSRVDRPKLRIYR